MKKYLLLPTLAIAFISGLASDSLPPTETLYQLPTGSLYYGLSSTNTSYETTVIVGPVSCPVEYINTSTTPGASFVWSYNDSNGEGNVSYSRDLTVTYGPDNVSTGVSGGTKYRFPILEGSSASTAPTEYSKEGYFQAGGRGMAESADPSAGKGETVEYGLSVIDPVTEGKATFTDQGVPLFGYSPETDIYWGHRAFGDDFTPNPDFNNCLERYADFFYTPEAPLTIESIRTNAFGKVDHEAVFTAEIYFLSPEFVIPDTPAYTLYCTGDDIAMTETDTEYDFLSLSFKADEPIVVSQEDSSYFIVAIGGFRDAEHVEYFNPEMSAEDNPDGLGLGWLGLQMTFEGQKMPLSWSSASNYTPDYKLLAFYIMLDASFPSGNENGVATPASAVTEGPAELYTIDGKRVSSNPAPGIYVRTTGQGEAQKVIIR